MIEYANDSVIRALRQYDMLLKSLKFISDIDQKEEIYIQMTKIIQEVLNITNSIYEEKYKKIIKRQTYLMDEEKNRLLELINLINERRTYINNQITNNEDITSITINNQEVLGEDKLDHYKNQVKIIDKYKNNIKLESSLTEEIKNLDINITRAQTKINNNKILNKQLEDKMIKLLEKTFTKLGLYELQERSKEIDLAYTELGYSLEKAKENAKIARKDNDEAIISECDNMLASITLEYERYKEKKLILKLIDIYNTPCDNYDSLLIKREEINNILTNITSSDLYKEVGSELNKEYATIKLESQDKATLKSLQEEKENKTLTLQNINEENNSEEFKSLLSNLLENEKKQKEKQKQEEKKREEERAKQRKIEEEKKQQEILKRQKLIEEERNREIERRTKQLLDEKKNPILNTPQEEKKPQPSYSPPKETNKKVGKSFFDTDTKEDNNKRVLKNIDINNTINNTIDFSSRSEKNKNIDFTLNTPSKKEPQEDIFKHPKSSKEEIPIIKNNDFVGKVVDVKKVSSNEAIFSKKELNKEEDIFPTLPSDNDDFFDAGEFEDLNKYVDKDSNKKSWF